MAGRGRRSGAANVAVLMFIALASLALVVNGWLAVRNAAPHIQDLLEEEARAALSGAPGVALRADADGRSLTVHGRVASEADRDAVVDRLVRIDGVVEIVDEITVVPTLGAVGGSSGRATPWTGDGAAAPAKAAAPTARPTPAPASTRPEAAPAPSASPAPARRAAATGPTAAAGTVHFAAGSARLDAGGRETVAAVARRALAGGGVVHVSGHADDAGTPWGDHDLSVERAAAVARALGAAGLPAARVRQHAAADRYPVAGPGAAANRRVELAIQERSR